MTKKEMVASNVVGCHRSLRSQCCRWTAGSFRPCRLQTTPTTSTAASPPSWPWQQDKRSRVSSRGSRRTLATWAPPPQLPPTSPPSPATSCGSSTDHSQGSDFKSRTPTGFFFKIFVLGFFYYSFLKMNDVRNCPEIRTQGAWHNAELENHLSFLSANLNLNCKFVLQACNTSELYSRSMTVRCTHD